MKLATTHRHAFWVLSFCFLNVDESEFHMLGVCVCPGLGLGPGPGGGSGGGASM